jgi:hypothetical protein
VEKAAGALGSSVRRVELNRVRYPRPPRGCLVKATVSLTRL